MFKTIKNQKGITLVELLAVMVIVGIIAAISIPAIGNLIENTRKDAYIATAKNMQEAARIVASQNAEDCATICAVKFGKVNPTTATTLVPATAINNMEVISGIEYIENMEADYLDGTANVVVINANGQVTYETTLTGTTNTTYKLATATATGVVVPTKPLDVMTWTRENVIRAVN